MAECDEKAASKEWAACERAAESVRGLGRWGWAGSKGKARRTKQKISTRAGDGHEEHEHDEDGAALAQQVGGGGGGDQPLARLGGRQRQVQRTRGQPQAGGQREGDTEPQDAACKPAAMIRRQSEAT